LSQAHSLTGNSRLDGARRVPVRGCLQGGRAATKVERHRPQQQLHLGLVGNICQLEQQQQQEHSSEVGTCVSNMFQRVQQQQLRHGRAQQGQRLSPLHP
jgi:hypothetical protein